MRIGREGRVPEDLLGHVALTGHGAGLGERHPRRLGRRVLLEPVDVLGQRVHGRRAVGVAAAAHRRAGRAAALDADAPLVHRLAVGQALVAHAGHGQPGVGEAPAERRILLAVVHVSVHADAVDLLDLVGEELGDVLVRGPVDRHAQLVAVLGAEGVLEVLATEPVVTEPVEVGELLVRQLVQLAVGRGAEVEAHEVREVEGGAGDVLALAGHEVGEWHHVAIAIVRTDQIGIVDVHVIDVAARLHLGLQLLDDVAFLDEIVGELDARDLAEGLRQHLGLVLVGGDGLGHHRDLHAGIRLGRLHEPAQLRDLLLAAQGAGLELIDPLLDRGLARGQILLRGLRRLGRAGVFTRARALVLVTGAGQPQRSRQSGDA